MKGEIMGITKEVFGKLADGREVFLFNMTNAKGMRVTVSNYGCAIVSLWVPDKNGKLTDVVTGFDTLDGYTGRHPFFGVVAGRVANRINAGKFTLDGKEYQLELNDGGQHHLHGGLKGFDKKLWDVEEKDGSLVFTLESPDGDSGYPGNLTARITYTLTGDNTFRMDYYAETDTKTICNLTNHSYFNLEGQSAKDIYGHELQINASHTTAVDELLIPTGELASVAGTAYDFRKPKTIGKDIAGAGLGYDDNFVLDAPGVAAIAHSPVTGITMTVKTDSPGVQLYTGNFLDGTVKGKEGAVYQKHSAFCLETQFYPDTVNQPNFPSCIVEKGKPQKFYTEFVFS
jgi:aldose 1-epimerase